jgi:hypothetical protein
MEEQEQPTAKLDSILRKVRAAIALAEAEGTPPHEAAQAQAMADALMLKYSVDQTMADKAALPQHKTKPIVITVQLGPDSDVIGYIAWLAQDIAAHCRCKVRPYSSWTDGGWNAKVYGFESDVRYFELLYTTLRLHMIGVLIPKVETHKSLEDNAYRLHTAGYNWLEIAEMYGWRKGNSFYYGGRQYDGSRPPADMKVPYYNSKENPCWQPATQVGSRIKRAYQREATHRGEAHKKLAANGTAAYRKSAANGYVARLTGRLREVARGRDTGSALILRSRIDDLDALFRKDNPDMFPSEEEKAAEEAANAGKKGRRVTVRAAPVNMEAYSMGAAYANTADLNATPRAGSSEGRALR